MLVNSPGPLKRPRSAMTIRFTRVNPGEIEMQSVNSLLDSAPETSVARTLPRTQSNKKGNKG